MDLSTDTLYQILRVLFALSLLGFLYLVIRTTMKELQPFDGANRGRSAMPPAELVTLPGESGSSVDEGLAFEIHGVTTLGRAESSRVLLNDNSVSVHHALLRPVDGAWVIEDLGSRNGTLVNGRAVSGPVEVDCGDSIQIGRVRLRLMC